MERLTPEELQILIGMVENFSVQVNLKGRGTRDLAILDGIVKKLRLLLSPAPPGQVPEPPDGPGQGRQQE